MRLMVIGLRGFYLGQALANVTADIQSAGDGEHREVLIC
jgi:hypothetical protein